MKEVACNNYIDTIKLTLWGSCIDYVNESSVYFVQQAKVGEWPKGILSITMTRSTSFNSSEENIVKSKSSLKELIKLLLCTISLHFCKNCIIHEMLLTSWEVISECDR